MTPPTLKSVLLFFGVCLVFSGGILLGKIYGERLVCASSVSFRFLNPQLRCEGKSVVDKQAYIGMRHTLEKLIEDKKAEGAIDSASIYFRDLDDGPTLGLNEHDDFVPASLLKLPLLLAYLNYQEERPGLLDEKMMIAGVENNLFQAYPPTSELSENVSYSVKELLRAMIVSSDNRALYALQNHLRDVAPGRDIFFETLVDLGLVDPTDITDETISVKGYSNIFLQLYSGSYLYRNELSENALAMLADSEFNQGIVAGLPEGMTVAHKFGERSDLPGGLNQLHDCGIVYYPGNPYLLCVMTRGKDFTALAKTISNISATVYEEFDSRRL